MTNKRVRRLAYEQYCTEHRALLPVFVQPWYLDAACGGVGWDVAISTQGGQVVAAWPYYLKTKWGIRYITMPPLTPCMGPLYQPNTHVANTARYRSEKTILHELAKKLPKTHLSTIYRGVGAGSSLSLRQQGYEIHQRYTYRVTLDDIERITAQIAPKQRNTIKQADKIYTLIDSEDRAAFYTLNEETFTRQGMTCPYDAETFAAIDDALVQQDARTILMAQHEDGTIDAALYLVSDQPIVYLMAIGSRADRRSLGGVPWLIAQALERYVSTHDVFDFEGSMIPSIERFFRSFGGQQHSYDHLIRTSSRWTKALFTLTNRI